jgi:hypothetical protein
LAATALKTALLPVIILYCNNKGDIFHATAL